MYQFCMFRLGEGCSHVAAILFKVECAVRLGYTSATSQARGLNDVYSKRSGPCFAAYCISYTLHHFLTHV